MGSARRSVLGELFAERQVYLRSRLGCHYVVLSRSLLIGVTLAMVLIVASIASISVGAVTTHLEGRAQKRELARLEGINQSLRAAIDAAGGQDALRRATDQLPTLSAELASVKKARARALELADAANAEVAELRRELSLAEDQIQDLEQALARIKAEQDEQPVVGMGGAPPVESPAELMADESDP
jgi:hypothetical protein